MYLTPRKFYLFLSVAILGIGLFVASSFQTSTPSIAINQTRAGSINLMPLSSVQSVIASEGSAETTEAPATTQTTAAAPQPNEIATPKPVQKSATAAPKPTIKTATASVQAAPTPSAACTGGLTAEFLCLLNKYRVSKGLGKISGNSALSKVALTHSTWMSTTGTFSHVGINGSRLGERCAAAGITCRGENLAYNINTAQGLLDSWKASPSHNANLLGNYTTAGMGIYGAYTTLLFN